MEDFIQKVKAQLGMSDDAARRATGGLFRMLESKLPDWEIKDLFSRLPGAHALKDEAAPLQDNTDVAAVQATRKAPPQPGEESESWVENLVTGAAGAWDRRNAEGGLMDKFEDLMGGDDAPLVRLLHRIQGSSLEPHRAGTFVTMFFNHMKEKLGPETTNRVIDQVPELKPHINS